MEAPSSRRSANDPAGSGQRHHLGEFGARSQNGITTRVWRYFIMKSIYFRQNH